jgi:hypothetical protein
MQKPDPLLERIEAYNEAQSVGVIIRRAIKGIPSSLSRMARRLPDCGPLVTVMRLRYCGGVTGVSGSKLVSSVE